jgi:HD-GYP domain-containing protein (c-di-GMP phosphodiesterase class II)
MVPASVLEISGELCERWDGTGAPAAVVAEKCSLAGRVLAAACTFDWHSAQGLEAGLQAIREGTGSAFDPVVASEVIHLFRSQLPQRRAA